MRMGPISRLICLLAVSTYLYRFQVRCYLLGYGFVYLLQPGVTPTFELLLELREEALDLNRLKAHLQAELDAYPSFSGDKLE